MTPPCTAPSFPVSSTSTTLEAMAETRFAVPQGDFDLIRYPPTRDPNLRAWDAADELILIHLAEVMTERAIQRVLVLNDAFGALAVGASAALTGVDGGELGFVSDSHLATLAMRQNIERNGLGRPDEWMIREEGSWQAVGAQSHSADEPEGAVDAVLFKIPKTLALLETQLVGLRGVLDRSSVIVGGGMTRDIHSSTLQLIEQTVGPTRTTRARKKARLALSELDPNLSPAPPEPSLVPLEIGDAQLVNLSGVFSANRLDNGTRLLLASLPPVSGGPDLIDLGCGNGALGIAALLQDRSSRVTFVDESRLAVRSAQASFERAFPASGAAGEPRPRFRVGDCLDGLPGDSADLILCNPPFHQGRAHGDDIAWKMFVGAKRVLRPGGQLWVVGNRHLDYLPKLKRALGNSQIMANDRKYQVMRSVR